jgi:hypothetical protein
VGANGGGSWNSGHRRGWEWRGEGMRNETAATRGAKGCSIGYKTRLTGDEGKRGEGGQTDKNPAPFGPCERPFTAFSCSFLFVPCGLCGNSIHSFSFVIW